MHIIYTCYGGAHSSPVAAAIHLGKLPTDRVPTAPELLHTQFYDQVDSVDHGKLLPVGIDKQGNKVYIFGRGKADTIAIQSLRSGWQLAGGAQDQLKFIDTLPCVNWLMRAGGFLSRSLGLITVGRPLAVWGTQKAYFRLVAMVRNVEAEAAEKE